MNFYLDERAIFSCFGNVMDDASSLEELIQLMECLLEAEAAQVHIDENFYSLSFEGQDVAQIIYEHAESGEVRDLLRRIEYIVSGADAIPSVEGEGLPIALCMVQAQKGGVITKHDFCEEEWWDSQRMYSLANILELPSVVRQYFVAEQVAEALFSDYSSLMFDCLYFHEPPSKIKNLGFQYSSEIARIIQHLGYLNDHVLADFESSQTDREVEIKAGSHGVTISPESNNTRRDRAAMKLREIDLFGETVCCEWHTKIRERQGRIHFYPWAYKSPMLYGKIGRKIVVGIICRHL